MESELARAVVVSVGGSRPSLDLADATAVLHVDFGCGPMDMSIHAFFLEDFLVLCRTVELKDRMVDRGLAMAGETPLMLAPWLCQSWDVGIAMPYLVQHALVGIPANAWSRRATHEVLRGIGLVVKVADCTTRWSDMSSFRVWLRTDDPNRIPPQRILVVEEPRRQQAPGREDAVDAFWYPVEIIKESPLVRPSWGSAPHLPPGHHRRRQTLTRMWMVAVVGMERGPAMEGRALLRRRLQMARRARCRSHLHQR
ncbi:hypothetical protein VPH35_052261 [Triticum aestivum]|uniref:DUF4283 domain-containing protein n=1 Tax=Triticum aestivum TaxID=4565 RepID=A0A3B6FRJ6_WHEAT